jgi:hypothetical protein
MVMVGLRFHTLGHTSKENRSGTEKDEEAVKFVG